LSSVGSSCEGRFQPLQYVAGAELAQTLSLFFNLPTSGTHPG